MKRKLREAIHSSDTFAVIAPGPAQMLPLLWIGIDTKHSSARNISSLGPREAVSLLEYARSIITSLLAGQICF
jgi:hypothetical protein